MDNSKIIDQAVVKAVEHAREHGLRIGQVVAHPSDPIAYNLIRIEGDTGFVGLPDSDEIKSFPLSEMFDPNDAMSFALRIQQDQIADQVSAAIGMDCMVLRLGA